MEVNLENSLLYSGPLMYTGSLHVCFESKCVMLWIVQACFGHSVCL